MILESLDSKLGHLPKDIFRNNEIELKENDESYKSLYENRKQYHFDKLIAYLQFFYNDDNCPFQIDKYEDVKRRYQIIVNHQTQTPNTKFNNNFC